MANLSSRTAYEGVETTDLAVTRTGTAIDPTGQAQSRKVATTVNSQWLRPYKAEPYTVWNGITEGDVTVTVYGVTANTLPNNDEIWMEVEYLGDSSAPLGRIATTTKSSVLMSGTSVSSDTSIWNGPILFPSTLDPATVAGVTLSAGNLIAVTTTSSTSAEQGARVAPGIGGQTTGKYYFEVIRRTASGSFNMSAGVGTTTSTYTGMGASPWAVVGATYKTSGAMTVNGTGFGSTAAQSITSAMGFAVDLDNRQVWFRHDPASPWNNNATYNPATNTGGFALPAGTMVPFLTFGGTAAVAGEQYDTNFGPSLIGVVPSGFYPGWGSNATKVPFKLTATISPRMAGHVYIRVRAAKSNAVYYIDPTPELSPTGATVGATTSNVVSRYMYEGYEVNDTTYTRTGAATNTLGQVIGRKIVTNLNVDRLRPYKSIPLARWNSDVGTTKGISVYGATRGTTLPFGEELWMDVEYLGSATSPIGTITRASVVSIPTGSVRVPDTLGWGGSTTVKFDGPITADVVLTNNDCTVTRTSTASNLGAASASYVSTGKHYFEIQMVGPNTTLSTFGLISSAWIPAGGLWNQSAALTYGLSLNMALSDTTILSEGTNTGISISPRPFSGDIFSFAVDLDGRKFWARKNGGSWNAQTGVANDPALGVGGVTIAPTVGFAPHVRFQLSTNTDDGVAYNFGAQPFAYDVPDGFGVAYVWLPFRLTAVLSSPPPNQAGYIHARVFVARPSSTYYIDPQIVIT